jgi:L,D-transpeptidase ErfK/SrfK
MSTRVTVLALVIACVATAARGQIVPLAPDQDLVGQPGEAQVQDEDTLPDIARRYHLGFDEIVAANPGVDTWLPSTGTKVRLPTQHLLPTAPRTGIVVNLADGRLYYFHVDRNGSFVAEIDPISIGEVGWKTPLVVTTIVSKEKMPTWYPPKSVREAHLKEDGDVLPGSVPPGPDNPLGEYALRLGIPGGSYLIHGTNKPVGVGMQITHGCIRLYPEDIERLYGEVRVGTTVRIVNQRIKTGWLDGALYLEVHPPLFAGGAQNTAQPDELTHTIVAATARQRVPIDWDTAERTLAEAKGVPVRISTDDQNALPAAAEASPQAH